MCQKPLLPSRLGHNFADLRFRHVTPDKFQVCHDSVTTLYISPSGHPGTSRFLAQKTVRNNNVGVEKACPERRRKVGL